MQRTISEKPQIIERALGDLKMRDREIDILINHPQEPRVFKDGQ